MVKLLFFYFIICLMLLGCGSRQNDYVFVQSNDQLVYVNYPEPTAFELPFSFFEDYVISVYFSLDVKEQKHKFQIGGDDSELIDRTIENFSDRYFEHEHVPSFSDTTSQIDIFLCGKLSLVDSISSFLISKEVSDDSGNVCRTLYLFNYKNKRQTSIVQLSVNISCDDISKRVTYVIDNFWPHNYYFSQIDYSYLFDPDTYISIEDYLSSQVVSKYIKVKKDLKVLYFSTFIIDENGFIKLINI